MIQVQNISKRYPLSRKQQQELQTTAATVYAVQDVSFTCQPGRIFSLLGPNGAGKTSTLRMIATLLQPTSGSITVNGADTVRNAQAVRQQLGFLTGSTQLYERLTPVEVLRYFAGLYGLAPEVFRRRKDQLFEELGIGNFQTKRIGQLSTGMKQKVSIARTMIHDPQVVVFDEPTSGLDVITSAAIIDLIRACKAAGKTVIFSSHIMSEVDLLCDELAIMAGGRIVYADTMEAFRAYSAGRSLTETFIQVVQKSPAL